MENESTLLLDLNSIPQGWDLEQLLHCWRVMKVVFYTSENGGVKPEFVNSVKDIKVVDISGMSSEEIEILKHKR